MDYPVLLFSNLAIFDDRRADFVIEDSELVFPILAQKNYRMLMMANGSEYSFQRQLDVWPFTGLLDRCFFSDDAGVAKPDPAFLRYVLLEANIGDVSEVLAIGRDLELDIQPAMQLGFDTCWWNPAGNDAGEIEIYSEMRCYEQLLDLV